MNMIKIKRQITKTMALEAGCWFEFDWSVYFDEISHYHFHFSVHCTKLLYCFRAAWIFLEVETIGTCWLLLLLFHGKYTFFDHLLCFACNYFRWITLNLSCWVLAYTLDHMQLQEYKYLSRWLDDTRLHWCVMSSSFYCLVSMNALVRVLKGTACFHNECLHYL